MSDFLTLCLLTRLPFRFMQPGPCLPLFLTGAVAPSSPASLVLKGWSLMGDAISHAVLRHCAGLCDGHSADYRCVCIRAFSVLLPPVTFKEHSRIKEDTVMGIVFSVCLPSVWCCLPALIPNNT